MPGLPRNDRYEIYQKVHDCCTSLILFYIHFSIIHIRTNMIPFKRLQKKPKSMDKKIPQNEIQKF